MYRLREGETSGPDDLSVDGFMAFLEGMFSLYFLIVAALSRLALAPEIRRFLSDPGVHREAQRNTSPPTRARKLLRNSGGRGAHGTPLRSALLSSHSAPVPSSWPPATCLARKM